MPSGKVDRSFFKGKRNKRADIPQVKDNSPSQDGKAFPVRGATIEDLPGNGMVKKAGRAIEERKKKMRQLGVQSWLRTIRIG